MPTIRQVKLGEFFKFVPSGRVFVRGEYDRSSRTFAYYPFDAQLSSVDDYIFEVKADQRQEGFTLSDFMWAKAASVQ